MKDRIKNIILAFIVFSGLLILGHFINPDQMDISIKDIKPPFARLNIIIEDSLSGCYYNFKTSELDCIVGYPDNYTNYIPQGPTEQKLYEDLVESGTSPFTAMLIVISAHSMALMELEKGEPI